MPTFSIRRFVYEICCWCIANKQPNEEKKKSNTKKIHGKKHVVILSHVHSCARPHGIYIIAIFMKLLMLSTAVTGQPINYNGNENS